MVPVVTGSLSIPATDSSPSAEHARQLQLVVGAVVVVQSCASTVNAGASRIAAIFRSEALMARLAKLIFYG
jgi:hypothetical protein